VYFAKPKRIYILSAAAGILYSSWPLGYVLNHKVATTSLASGLEAVHQPYNWVFVGADIASSIAIIAVCILVWRAHKGIKLRRPALLGLLCTILFGVGTIIDALLPERCVPNLMVCPSFTQDHTLLIHGIFSILASVALFVALVAAWFQKRRDAWLVALLAGYIIFGAISLLEAVVPGNHGNWSQDYYMALCSVWLVCVPAYLLPASTPKLK
jgi:hypothetical protein